VTETTPSAPAGWYPDANALGGQRWWDGTQWTEHVSGPAPYQPFAPATAPEGTRTNTVWIWLIAILPILSVVSLFTTDVSSILPTTTSGGPYVTPSASELYLSPAYLLSTLGGWVLIAALIVFGALDYRALKARGVPQPFHWAWSFFAVAGFGLVYPIGRGIVAKRRTGSGMAPTWVAIGVFVVGLIIGVVWFVSFMQAMLATFPTYPVS
jgi:hypothetical protein